MDFILRITSFVIPLFRAQMKTVEWENMTEFRDITTCVSCNRFRCAQREVLYTVVANLH